MGGQPVEVLGAVMDGMEPPEKADAVLQAMAPVDKKSLSSTTSTAWSHQGCVATAWRNPAGRWPLKPCAEMRQQPEDHAVPEEILAEKIAEIGNPCRPEEPLARFGGKATFERAKDDGEEDSPTIAAHMMPMCSCHRLFVAERLGLRCRLRCRLLELLGRALQAVGD